VARGVGRGAAAGTLARVRCAAQSFSDVASQDEQSTLVFQEARFADRVSGPITAFLPADGMFPGPQDFR
jgi:hypothetical protein